MTPHEEWLRSLTREQFRSCPERREEPDTPENVVRRRRELLADEARTQRTAELWAVDVPRRSA